MPRIARGVRAMSLEVRTLSPALGAEILGVDLRNEVAAETLAAILDAWHQHLVILFRNQVLSEDDQIRFARHFGVLQQRGRPAEARNEASRLEHPELTMLVSNIRENGKLIGSLADGEMHFHSDFCYVEKPAKGTFLYAMEIPSQGGDTLFLNMYKAYDTLPSALKARVEGRKAVNAYHYESVTRESTAPSSTLAPTSSMRSRSCGRIRRRGARRSTSTG
jgi:taurine dioxygenase